MIFARYVLSKLRWTLTVYEFPLTWLKQNLDSSVLCYVRKWFQFHPGANTTHLTLPSKHLGAGVSLISGLFENCQLSKRTILKGELQRENKLISYERAFKMLENDMYIAGIGQVVLELLSFKVESGNHQRGISLLQKFSDIFGNMRLVPLKMTSHLTSHNFQILKIEIFCKLYKI